MTAEDMALAIELARAGAPEGGEARYRAIEDAQGSGEYEGLLERIEQEVRRGARERIASDLDLLRRLPEAFRAKELDWLLRYWSRSKEAFEETGLRLARATKRTDAELRAGGYDPELVAERLIDACERYDRDVTIPIVEQIAERLARFEGARFLLLGRDFTCVYLFMRRKGTVARERLHHANVSRNVRDKCMSFDGKDVLGERKAEALDPARLEALRLVLERAGLSRGALLEGASLVVGDSSMKGKIPAAILRAIAEPLSPRERFQVLAKTHVRYLRSSRREGDSIRELAEKLGGERKELGSVELARVLDGRRKIREFEGIRYSPQVASHVQRRHKVLEWRPKSVQVADDVGIDAGGTPRLVTRLPTTPAERIACELGVLADLRIMRAGDRRPAAISVPAFAPLPLDEVRRQIDRAASLGVAGLRRWQRERPTSDEPISIVETKESLVPYALVQGDRIVRRLRRIAGEGNNVVAYVTEEDTILKVTKRPAHARKNLLLAWAEEIVREAGIDAARVLSVPSSGLFLEQEYVPGESLEERYGGEGKILPARVKDLVLADYERAKRLVRDRGLWLDLKSANYQEREDGRIAIVDYTPRVNETHHRYFRHDDGRELTEEEFLDKFLHHDMRKRCARR